MSEAPWRQRAFHFGTAGKRLPKSLHIDLVRRADEENVSLNTLAISFLSFCLGRKQPIL